MSQLAHPVRPASTGPAGTVSIVTGVLALLGSAWVIYLTLGSAGPELSNLLRALGSALLPVGLLVGIPTGIVAVRHGGAQRTAGYVGLALAAVALAAFVVLLASVDY